MHAILGLKAGRNSVRFSNHQNLLSSNHYSRRYFTRYLHVPKALQVNILSLFLKKMLIYSCPTILSILLSSYLVFSTTYILCCYIQLMKFKFKFNSECQLSPWYLIMTITPDYLSKITPPLTENLSTKHSARSFMNIISNSPNVDIITLMTVNWCLNRFIT